MNLEIASGEKRVQDLKAKHWPSYPEKRLVSFAHTRPSEPCKEVPTVMRPFQMLKVFSVFSPTLIVLSLLITNAAALGINFPVHRRGGRFAKHEVANFTRLEDLLRQTETRYSRTYRDVGDNSLVRRWASSGEIIEHHGLLASLDDSGSWYPQAASSRFAS